MLAGEDEHENEDDMGADVASDVKNPLLGPRGASWPGS